MTIVAVLYNMVNSLSEFVAYFVVLVVLEGHLGPATESPSIGSFEAEHACSA